MPPGQQHRRVPPAILSLLLLLAVLFSNVKQGLGKDIAGKVEARDGNNAISAAQSEDTHLNPIERSDKSSESNSGPSSGTENNSAQNSGANNFGTFLKLLAKLVVKLLKSQSHNRDQGDNQKSQLSTLKPVENSNDENAPSSNGDNEAKASEGTPAPDTGVSKVAKPEQEENGAPGSCDDGTGSQTIQKTPPENNRSGQEGGEAAGATNGPTDKLSEERQPDKNPPPGGSPGEPKEANEVQSSPERNSDRNGGGDLRLREPVPTAMTRRKRKSIGEINVVNFVSWKLNKAAGVKTIGIGRNSIRRKLTVIYANRIKIAFSSGTRSSEPNANGVLPYRSSYKIYRGVISNGRVLKFEELRPTAYRGFRTVGMLNVGLAVALYCQKQYSGTIHVALRLQCRVWKRKYRNLFYQYEKLRSVPSYNRGSDVPRGNLYSNEGPQRAEDENAPSDVQQRPSAVEQRKLPSESDGIEKPAV